MRIQIPTADESETSWKCKHAGEGSRACIQLFFLYRDRTLDAGLGSSGLWGSLYKVHTHLLSLRVYCTYGKCVIKNVVMVNTTAYGIFSLLSNKLQMYLVPQILE